MLLVQLTTAFRSRYFTCGTRALSPILSGLAFCLLAMASPASAKNIFEPDYTGDCSYVKPAPAPEAGPAREGECDDLPVFGKPGMTTLYSSTTMPTYTPDEFKIEGRLVIDVTTVTVLWSGKTVKMGNAAEIVLNPNTALVFSGGTVVEGCSTMWKGVTVGQGAFFNVQSGSQVNDAVNVALVPNSNDCWIALSEATFHRNYRIVFAYSSTVGSNINFILRMGGCTYDGAGPLKPPHSEQYFYEYGPKGETAFRFIRCNSVAGNLKVGGSVLCTITNYTYGVASNYSNIPVENCKFTEITGTPSFGIIAGGMGIYGEYGYYSVKRCTFYHCYDGINLYKMDFDIQSNTFNRVGTCVNTRLNILNTVPSISDNTVDGANFGFVLTQNNDANPQIFDNNLLDVGRTAVQIMDDNIIQPNRSFVSDNTVELSGGGGWPNASIDGSGIGVNVITTSNAVVCANQINHNPHGGQDIGIIASGSELCTIDNNTVTQNGEVQGLEHVGMMITNTIESTVDCNSFNNNAQSGMEVAGTCTNTTISTNNFNGGHSVGMRFISATTKVQEHNGNKWNYATSVNTPGATLTGGNAPANLFQVDVSDGTNLLPFRVPGSWFVNQSGNTKTCHAPYSNTGCTTLVPFAGDNPDKLVLNDLANGAGSFKDFTEANLWLEQRRMLVFLLQKNLTQTRPYSEFWDKMAQTSQAKLAQLEMDVAAWNTQHKAQQDRIAALHIELKDLVKCAEQCTTAQAQVVFERKRAAMEQLEQVYDAEHRDLLAHIAEVYASLPDDKVFVQNEKRLNALLFDLRFRERATLTRPEETMLDAIARQCVFEGGNAVLQARTLLAQVNDVNYRKFDNCTQRAEERILPAVADALKVSPNPAIDGFRLQTPTENCAGGQLILFDIAGRIRWQQNILQQDDYYQLPAGFEAGVYFIEVRDAQGMRAGATRLVLQPE